jgi:hypothetical protein
MGTARRTSTPCSTARFSPGRDLCRQLVLDCADAPARRAPRHGRLSRRPVHVGAPVYVEPGRRRDVDIPSPPFRASRCHAMGRPCRCFAADRGSPDRRRPRARGLGLAARARRTAVFARRRDELRAHAASPDRECPRVRRGFLRRGVHGAASVASSSQPIRKPRPPDSARRGMVWPQATATVYSEASTDACEIQLLVPPLQVFESLVSRTCP